MSKKAPAKRLTATKKKAPKGDLKKQMAGNAEIIQKAFGSKIKKAKATDGNFEIVPQKAEIIKPSDRPINDIIREKIAFKGGGAGVEIDKSLTPQECVSAIAFFSTLEEATNFIIGDLIEFAKKEYGENIYEGMMKATGIKHQSLENIAAVARNVSPSIRQESLTFTHHTAVAKLPPAQQKSLLIRAKKEGLSATDLKKEVKILAPPKPRAAKASDDKTDKPIYSKDTGPMDDFEMSKEAIEKDEKALEKADTVLLYIKSAAFGYLNAKARDAWKSLLMQFSDAYERLLKA